MHLQKSLLVDLAGKKYKLELVTAVSLLLLYSQKLKCSFQLCPDFIF